MINQRDHCDPTIIKKDFSYYSFFNVNNNLLVNYKGKIESLEVKDNVNEKYYKNNLNNNSSVNEENKNILSNIKKTENTQLIHENIVYTTQYKHFVLNSSRTIKAEEVHSFARDVFNLNEYKIKRIKKPLFNYMRISIIKSLPNDTINSGMQFIAHRLEATFREQSLNRRPDLESGKNGESPLSSIITLNINGIKSKYNELLMLLQQRKPDIICLQETKKLVTDKRIHINGYQIHDVPEQGQD